MLDLGVSSAVSTSDPTSPTYVATEPIGAVLRTLVPNSGLQFIDLEMREEAVERTRRRFLEEVSSDGEPSLHVAASDGGVIYHPVTNQPCDPAQTYLVGGGEALEPFLGRWLPLPFMRVSRSYQEGGYQQGPHQQVGDEEGNEENGATVLDEGPSNWTRVHISRPDAKSNYRVVLAIDTAVEHDETRAVRDYVAPTLEDLKASAPFRFSDDVNDIAWFVSEAWVDEWVKTAFDEGRSESGRTLQHLASYLTLLGVLREAGELPALRFMSAGSIGAFAETVPVNLALDLGTSQTAVLLDERHKAGRNQSAAPSIRALPLRNLSEPWRVTQGPFASRLSFCRADFGSEALSRWSGRASAFYWPSIARLGAEAERLGALDESADTLTSISSPMHYVWDERPSRHVWRFAGSNVRDLARVSGTGARRNPVVSGTILGHLTETGDLAEDGQSQTGTTKPRFSRSSLVTLQVAEILLQAISAINAPKTREAGERPHVARRLDRLVVTPPAGMGEAETGILRRRVESAVKLVWQTMGWAAEAHPLAPPPPSVTIGADSATATQFAYLENEIAHKFRGKATSLFALLGRPRGGFQGARTLRIGTLDIGAASSSFSVVTYEPTPGNGVAGLRQLVDGFDIGFDSFERAIAERTVLAALEQRLAECRHGDTAKFIASLLGTDDRGRPGWVGDLGRRVAAELLAPAATALARLYAASDPEAGDAPTELTIGALLASVGVEARAVADRLDVAAADEGADGFSPLDVTVAYLMRDLGKLASQTLRPMLDGVVRVLSELDCDVVLVSGRGAELPVVREALLSGMPLRPDRVLFMHEHRFGAWYAQGHAATQAEGSTAKLLPAAGALLQARGAFGSGGPELVLRPSERAGMPAFIGPIGTNGRIAPDDILFDLTAEAASASPRSGSREASGVLTRSASFQLPALIGVRLPSLSSWPARVHWIIERNPAAEGRPPKMPARLTLEFTPATRGRASQLRIAAAVDGDGGRIDEEDLVLRLQTRRSSAGHWLDTGHLVAVTNGSGSNSSGTPSTEFPS